MEEIIFSLKHYWRFVDSEALELKALSQGATRKPHEHRPISEIGEVRAMRLLCEVIQQTGDLTLLTDGERRYGNLLFELCSEALRNGKRGRPKKTLPKGVKVRLKNKGSQRHKRGPKRPKYQAPYPEHPDTAQPVATTDIHANHLEAFHTSLRRRCAAYRRRTNMYAKKTRRLQERLDVYWIVHNFVRMHFTTRQVPAVALGILDHGFALHELFLIQKAA